MASTKHDLPRTAMRPIAYRARDFGASGYRLNTRSDLTRKLQPSRLDGYELIDDSTVDNEFHFV